MKRALDRKTALLNDLNPKWELPSLAESAYRDLFKLVPPEMFSKLIRECREEAFGKDATIFKEGERATEALFLTRGAGTEHSTRGAHKIAEKRVRGELAPLYVLVTATARY